MTSDAQLNQWRKKARAAVLNGRAQVKDKNWRCAKKNFEAAKENFEKVAEKAEGPSVKVEESLGEVKNQIKICDKRIEEDTQNSEKPGSPTTNKERGRGEPISVEDQGYETPDLDFSGVGGMGEVKRQFQRHVIHPLENQEWYDRHGVSINNGILLHGPPGTGKSYISEAVAGELEVPFVAAEPSEVTSKFVGKASDLIKSKFDEARTAEPCVLFLDELDALAASRDTDMKQTRSERQAVTQLLQEMQNIQGSDVLVIAATNLLDDLDGAILRSGRFNTHINVCAPDTETREAVFEVHLRSKHVGGSVDTEELAEFTEGFSCSDIAEVVKSAVREAARKSAEKDELVKVHQRDLLHEVQAAEPSLKHWEE